MGLSSKKSSSSTSSSAPANAALQPARTARPTHRLGPRDYVRQKQLERSAELSALEFGALYIILFYRAPIDNYHWGLYHHISQDVGGWKYHIQGSGARWYPDHGTDMTTGVLASAAVVGLVRLTNVGVGQDVAQAVRRQIIAEDETLLGIEGLTCRVYVARACERLTSARYLNFPDWAHLQAEIFEFANRARLQFDEGGSAPKPRPVMSSAVAS